MQVLSAAPHLSEPLPLDGLLSNLHLQQSPRPFSGTLGSKAVTLETRRNVQKGGYQLSLPQHLSVPLHSEQLKVPQSPLTASKPFSVKKNSNRACYQIQGCKLLGPIQVSCRAGTQVAGDCVTQPT